MMPLNCAISDEEHSLIYSFSSFGEGKSARRKI
jgi:hypothetical protein